MTDIPATPDQAAALAAFYAGSMTEPTPPVVEDTTVTDEVRGGVYTPEEMAATAANMAATIEPGSWRDLEMRGVPTINWPEAVMAQFIEDQSKPQPPIWTDPRMAAAAAQAAATQAAAAPSSATVATGPSDYRVAINELVTDIHKGNVDAGWWTDLTTGETLLGKDQYGRDRRNVGELLCLVHSEVSEAMEGYRKGLMDDKLPHRSMLEVELADTIIRICDIAGAHGLDLGGAIVEKREFNASRADHKKENRLKADGKKF
jgi:NTP pyrophosphatase (non-canonical NTP hydrolase)